MTKIWIGLYLLLPLISVSKDTASVLKYQIFIENKVSVWDFYFVPDEWTIYDTVFFFHLYPHIFRLDTKVCEKKFITETILYYERKRITI